MMSVKPHGHEVAEVEDSRLSVKICIALLFLLFPFVGHAPNQVS